MYTKVLNNNYIDYNYELIKFKFYEQDLKLINNIQIIYYHVKIFVDFAINVEKCKFAE